jgi:hypothetical protein
MREMTEAALDPSVRAEPLVTSANRTRLLSGSKLRRARPRNRRGVI